MWLLGLSTIAACLLFTAADNYHIKQVFGKKCTGFDYSLACFKLDMLRLITKVRNKTEFRIAPGIVLVGTEETSKFSDVISSNVMKPRTTEEFDDYLKGALTHYLGTMNLTMQLGESRILSGITDYSNSIGKGRGKKSSWYSIFTVAFLTFAMIAALSGKALMISVFAIMMSGLSALRGGGVGAFGAPGGRITQYDIVMKPSAYAAEPAGLYDHQTAADYTTPFSFARRIGRRTDPL